MENVPARHQTVSNELAKTVDDCGAALACNVQTRLTDSSRFRLTAKLALDFLSYLITKVLITQLYYLFDLHEKDLGFHICFIHVRF